MSISKKKYSIRIDELIVLLISITYAGISSSVFLGFRVIDILIFVFFVTKLRTYLTPGILIVMTLWFTSVICSTIIGYINNTEFLASDTRFFFVLGLAAFLGFSLGRSSNIDMEKLYYKLMGLILIVYFIIPFLSFVQFFYVPPSFQKDEHAETVFGPSLVIFNYLYVYLVLKNKDRSVWFYLSYFVFALIIYKLRISRQDLVIMTLFFLWSLVYKVHTKIKIQHILLGAFMSIFGTLFIYFNNSERIKGIFNPSEDTSFVYREITNKFFLDSFEAASVVTKTLGYGMGSTFLFYYNDWFGRRSLTILDNTPLTLIMKSGFLGLVAFIIMVYYPVRHLSFHKKILILFPILFSMMLFSHAIYNLLYVFGVYFIAFKLKQEKESII